MKPADQINKQKQQDCVNTMVQLLLPFPFYYLGYYGGRRSSDTLSNSFFKIRPSKKHLLQSMLRDKWLCLKCKLAQEKNYLVLRHTASLPHAWKWRCCPLVGGFIHLGKKRKCIWIWRITFLRRLRTFGTNLKLLILRLISNNTWTKDIHSFIQTLIKTSFAFRFVLEQIPMIFPALIYAIFTTNNSL